MIDGTLPSTPLPALPGRLAEAYAILAPWGAGRAGSVWRACEQDSQRAVALKLAPADPGSSNIEFRRCLHEARVLRRLAHPNAIRVLDAGEVDGVAYWVSPFLEGDNVGALLGGPLVPLDRVIGILRDVAGALDHAATTGIIHGALVPRKILLDADGTAVVSDFRIDTLLSREPELELLPPAAYLAPELREGGVVDSRVDQYALAVIAYELLTGAGREQEVAGRSLAAIELLDLKAGRPLRPGLRAEASEVIHRGTLRDPSWRYPTSTDFVEALAEAVSPRADLELPPARRRDDSEEQALELARRRQRRQLAMLVAAACVGTFLAARSSFQDRMLIDRTTATNARRRPASAQRVASNDTATRTQPQVVEPLPSELDEPAPLVVPDSTADSTGANGGPGGTRLVNGVRVPIATASLDGGVAAAAAAARREDARNGVVIVTPATGAPDALVFVDSVSRGQAPLVLRLPPGRHRIRLETNGRAVAPTDTLIVVGSGQTTSVAFRLNRLGAGAAPRGATPAPPVTPLPVPSAPARVP
jgi:serine/threonine protein kinase